MYLQTLLTDVGEDGCNAALKAGHNGLSTRGLTLDGGSADGRSRHGHQAERHEKEEDRDETRELHVCLEA